MAKEENEREELEENLTEVASEQEASGEPDDSEDAAEDFSSQSKEQMVDLLSQLLKNDEVKNIMPTVKNLRAAYEELVQEEEKKQLQEYLEAGGFEAMFAPAKDPLDSKFRELINVFEDRKKKFLSEKKASEKQNLHIREQVIEELKKLINEEDKIGKAFQRFKELQDQWSKAGDAPLRKRKQLEGEYHFQVEMFYYNIKINKDLKELDLQKHLEQKTELLRKMDELLKISSIKNVESLIKQYREEWMMIGPVVRSEKDRIINEFNEATKKVFKKIRDHYEAVRNQQQANLQLKGALCEKIEGLNEVEIDSLKGWNSKTKEVLAIQEEWKKIGFAGKKDNDTIWIRFRNACNSFFEKKKSFFDGLKNDYESNRQKKTALCEKAEAVMNSQQWEADTELLIGLQKEWKTIGPAGRKDDNHLWKRFRNACDHFFEAKKQRFLELKEDEKQNLERRKEFLNHLEKTSLTGNAEQDVKVLKDLEKEWEKLGEIPRQEIQKIYSEYTTLLNKKYEQLNIDADQKSLMIFRNKVERLKHSKDSVQLLRREKKFLQDQLQKAESSVLQYENNLGFFAKSGKADFLKKEVEKNVIKAKEEVKAWQDKLKVLKGVMKDLPEETPRPKAEFSKKNFRGRAR